MPFFDGVIHFFGKKTVEKQSGENYIVPATRIYLSATQLFHGRELYYINLLAVEGRKGTEHFLMIICNSLGHYIKMNG